MKVLITAGTGKVGSELTKRIFKSGHEPVIMTHSIEHLKELPDGVEGILADFEKPDTWEEALKGIQKVCLITPPLQDESSLGTAFAKFATENEIDQIVLLSIHKAEAAMHIPHFVAKVEMEEVIKKSDKAYTFIRANNFFQNDQWFLSGVEKQGMYTQPLGDVGLNRVDVRDVADAITNSLLDKKHFNKTYSLVGAEILTGRKTAQIYSEIVGNKIRYPENCLEIWESNFKSMIPNWLLEDWKMMYEFFLMEGLTANKYDLNSTIEILGKQPRTFRNYVNELLKKNHSSSFNSKDSNKFDSNHNATS